jgi:hypothetical protein
MILSLFATFRYGFWRIAQTVMFFQDPANHWGARRFLHHDADLRRELCLRHSLSRLLSDYLAVAPRAHAAP